MWGSLCEVFDQQPVDDTTKLTIQLTTVRGIALLIPPLFTKQAGVSTPRPRDTRNTEMSQLLFRLDEYYQPHG